MPTSEKQNRPDVKLQARIIANPGIQGGRPVIKGTRVPIYVVIGGVAAGATVQEVSEAYGITVADVRAALKYAASAVKEERILAVPSR